jgi:hypothetical protein
MVHCRHSMSKHEIQGVPFCRRGLAGTVIKRRDVLDTDMTRYDSMHQDIRSLKKHLGQSIDMYVSPPIHLPVIPAGIGCIAAPREKPIAKRRTMMVRPRPGSILSFCLKFHDG